MSEQNKLTNFYNGQRLDVDDLERDQDYFNCKIERAMEDVSLDGVSRVTGLQVSLDSVMAEPFDFPTVINAGTPTSDFKNFQTLPLSGTLTQAYQVFKAETNNVQRIDLKVQHIAGTGDSFLSVEIRKLQTPNDPLSSITDDKIFSALIPENELPTEGSDGLLVIDTSGENTNTGITLVQGNYYALFISFTSESSSTDQLRLFHSNSENTISDENLHAWFFVDGKFQQGLFNEEAILQKFVLYHKIYTDAVKVNSGRAYKNGKPILVSEDEHRFLSLVDRNPPEQLSEHSNFVAIRYKQQFGDPEQHPRTKNNVNTTAADITEVKVFTKAEWDIEKAKTFDDREWLLLAKVIDRNIIPIESVEAFSLTGITNLAYHNWLNPRFTTPSTEALNVKASRPNDLIFFLESVPAEIPLLNSSGGEVLDSNGNPQVEVISKVNLVVFPASGNQRELEMSLISETTAGSKTFRNYVVTLTDIDEELSTDINTFNLDKNEVTANAFYNFVALTDRGTHVFIQDFNIQVKTPNPSQGSESTLTREREFEVFLTAGQSAISVEEDLKLGIDTTFELSEEIIDFEDKGIIEDELATKVGKEALTEVIFQQDTVDNVTNVFGPLPASKSTGDNIYETTDTQSVADDKFQAAYGQPTGDTDADNTNNTHFVLKVKNASNVPGAPFLSDGVDVTLSGTENIDRGGNGGVMTISGIIEDIDGNSVPNGTTLQIKTRNGDGKDCTDQSTTYVATYDSINDRWDYLVIARGKGLGSEAGFFDGEDIYLWVDNRQVLEPGDGEHVTVVFHPSTAVSATTSGDPGFGGSLGSDSFFFGEKIIVSKIDRASAGDLNVGEVAIDPFTGEILWASGEEPPSDATITVEFYQKSASDETVVAYLTKFTPWGTNTNIPIENNDVSIAAAVAAEYFTIKVDGVDVTDPGFPGGPFTIVSEADHPILDPDQISVDPEFRHFSASLQEEVGGGRIKFHRTKFPNQTSSVTVTYRRLRPIFASTAAFTGEVYTDQFDFNGNGEIDETDLNTFLLALGSSSTDINYNSAADFDNDGDVDNDDFEEFIKRFGTKAIGTVDWNDAITGRLNSILVFKKDDPSVRLEVVKASSRGPATVGGVFGKTILFLSEDTPVLESGTYVVKFGFASALFIGPTEFQVETVTELLDGFNLNTIEIFKEDDVGTAFSVISHQSELLESGNFRNTFTFAPPVQENGNYVLRSRWEDSNVSVEDTRRLLKTVDYEYRHRRFMGPYKIFFKDEEFRRDGTEFVVRFDEPDATFSDGALDLEGTHINGLPITAMRFTVYLFVPGINNEVSVWRWNGLTAPSVSGGLRLNFSEALSPDDRFKGRNNVSVLHPFGTTDNQVALMPKYAGGDIENDLSNVIVIRDDFNSRIINPHDHSDDNTGGLLTSDDISFFDPDARFTPGDITDIIYQLDNAITALSGSEINNVQITGSLVPTLDCQFSIGTDLKRWLNLYLCSTIDYETSLDFVNAGITRVVFDQNGNVGIGSTVPAVELDVIGSVQVSRDVSISRDISVLRDLAVSGGGVIAGSDGLMVSTGPIGIGTTAPVSGADLSILTDGVDTGFSDNIIATFRSQGDARAVSLELSDGVSNSHYISYIDGALALGITGQENIRFTEDGRLGIGTTDPSSAVISVSTTQAINITGGFFDINASASAVTNGLDLDIDSTATGNTTGINISQSHTSALGDSIGIGVLNTANTTTNDVVGVDVLTTGTNAAQVIGVSATVGGAAGSVGVVNGPVAVYGEYLGTGTEISVFYAETDVDGWTSTYGYYANGGLPTGDHGASNQHAYGFYADFSESGATNIYGVYADLTTSQITTTGDVYGVFVDGGSTAANVDNLYGVYADMSLASGANSTFAARLLGDVFVSDGQLTVGATPVAGLSATTFALQTELNTLANEWSLFIEDINSDDSILSHQGLGVQMISNTSGTGIITGYTALTSRVVGNHSSEVNIAGLFGATGTSSTCYGVRASATGGSTNWAGFFESGDVFIQNDLQVGGTVQIGASPGSTFQVEVDGDINVTGDVRKNGTAYTNPDYVFESNYQLMPLSDLKNFVFEHKHLPNVPSTKQVETEGIALFESGRVTLEKVEELYLYIFQLQEKIDNLERQVVRLTQE